jgi:hypothetical protein
MSRTHKLLPAELLLLHRSSLTQTDLTVVSRLCQSPNKLVIHPNSLLQVSQSLWYKDLVPWLLLLLPLIVTLPLELQALPPSAHAPPE